MSTRQSQARGRRWRDVALLGVGLSVVVLVPQTRVEAQSEDPYVARHIHGEHERPRDVAADPVEIAREYARANFEALGVGPTDLDELEVRSHHTSAHNGVTHVYLQQVVEGIDVYGGRVTVNVGRTGRVISAGSRLLPDVAVRINSLLPAISPEDALHVCARAVGIRAEPGSEALLEDSGDVDFRSLWSLPSLSRRSIPVRLKLVPVEDAVRLA